MAEVSFLVQQRHVATQTNEDGNEGDVEVISTTYAKAFKCYACDSWKKFTRRSGMTNKGNHNSKYTRVHNYMQTERIQGSSSADGRSHRTASPSRAQQHAKLSLDAAESSLQSMIVVPDQAQTNDKTHVQHPCLKTSSQNNVKLPEQEEVC